MTFMDGFTEDFDKLSKTVLQLSKSKAGEADASVATGVGFVEAELKARALEAIENIETRYRRFLANATVIINNLAGGFESLGSDQFESNAAFRALFAAVEIMNEVTGKAEMATDLIADVSMCASAVFV